MGYERDLKSIVIDPTKKLDDEAKPIYVPSVWQTRFHCLNTTEALGAGSAGPGKSYCLKWDPCSLLAIEHSRCADPTYIPPGFDRPYPIRWGTSKLRILFLRRTTNMLDQHISDCRRMYPLGIEASCKWSEGKREFSFASGAILKFGHCQQRDDYNNYLSKEFCVAKGTPVLMGDRTYRAIEGIVAGDTVMTLRGPRTVTATWHPGVKPCVEVVVRDRDGLVGRQVQPTTHPVLLPPNAVLPAPLSARKHQNEIQSLTGECVWQDYESLLCGRQESPVTRVSSIDDRTYYGEFGDARLDVSQLPTLSVPVVLHGPRLRPLNDVVARDGEERSQKDVPGIVPSDTRLRLPYRHFYSRQIRYATEETRTGTADLRFFGYCDTYDLTVEGENHYITQIGLVSGQTYIAFDELTQFDKGQYDAITSRLRVSDPVLSRFRRVRSMSNPLIGGDEQMRGIKVLDPHWVRKYFVDPAPQGGKILERDFVLNDGTKERRSRIYLPARLSDNPDKDFVRQYELELRSKPEHIRKAMLDGDWYHVPGSFFGQHWNSSLHVCKPFRIPPDWKRFRSMDWGFKTHGVILWWAMDTDGNAYVERELTFIEKGADEMAKEVLNWEREQGLAIHDKSTLTGPSDTQLWERRDTAMSKAEIFARNGVRWVPADKKSRKNNAYLLIARMKDQRGGIAGITFFENCRMCTTTIPSIPTDANDREVPADTKEDHWLDAVLYGVAYISRRTRGHAENSDWDSMIPKDVVQKETRGRTGYWNGG